MKRNLLFFIVALLITSMACNVMGGKDESEKAESQAPVQETTGAKAEPVSGDGDQEETSVQEEQASAEEDEEQALGETEEEQAGASGSDEQAAIEQDSEEMDEESDQSEIGLEAINSYRSHRTWQAESADGSLEQIIIDDEMVREPNAYHSTIQVIRGDDIEIWETIRLGDTQWTRFDSEWMKSQIEPIDFEDNQTIFYFMDYAAYVESGAFSEEGKETVNGIKTRRYRSTSFDEEGLDLTWLYAMQSSYSMTQDVTELENVSDEYWIADDKDLPVFLVRHVQEAKGLDSNGQVVVFTDIFEVYDLNESITIEAPEDVLAGWPPDDIPQCSDATVDTSTAFGEGGVMLITCPGDFDTVSGFYQDGLDAAGWTQADSSKPMDTMLVEVWTKDGRTMNLLVQQEGNACTVTITVEGN